ncbi:MAG: hypothetical protein ACYTGL_23945 [Planctomycetota bacterium]|jgi:hypothetical protein
MLGEFLQIGERICVAPVIHGSGDFAIEIRRIMLSHRFDCLAVPLPPSFQTDVEAAVDQLPTISVVIQEEPSEFNLSSLDDNSAEASSRRASYVPIDPCQPVVAALRIARQERMPRAFIDLETDHFECHGQVFPDPYALKHVSIARFAAATLPAIPRPDLPLHVARIRHMAERLQELEQRFERILFVCSLSDWLWIRDCRLSGPADSRMSSASDPDAFNDDDAERSTQFEAAVAELLDEPEVAQTQLCTPSENSLMFLLGELPFITGLYEQARAELDSDENLSVDGLKELLLAARESYQLEMRSMARRITPKLGSVWLRYVRNLALIESRMTPDLYSLVVAAQQIFGDQFAIALAETARRYPFTPEFSGPEFSLSVDKARFPDGGIGEAVSRLPGPPVTWRTCELNRKPPKIDQERWKMAWNPFRQCSWPPEDVAIEKFRNHVKDAALAIMGADLARTEKFSTSLKDGLDIRETLRNWHTGDLYVRMFPPQIGTLDCVLMFFDSPADPRDYPWRITWMAEHHDESTLALFATSFQDEIVGPGIGQARYGGAMFLFPPRSIPEVWTDPRLDFVDTLEERLLAAACTYSNEKHIAVLSEAPPGIGWRRLAKRYGRKLVHVPIGRFSQETIQQLRTVHVLNGHEVRSFAAHFIRKP